MKKAVKTEQKAIEILQNWLTENLTGENLSTNTVIDTTTTYCECGETTAMRAFYEGGSEIAIVPYCDCCGNNDAFINDVLEII